VISLYSQLGYFESKRKFSGIELNDTVNLSACGTPEEISRVHCLEHRRLECN
jgi:hypothetical protein